MKYYIQRGGQQYGPYAMPDLHKYFADGAIVATDLARGEDGENWVAVTQVLGAAEPGTAAPPLPPSLHWGLVLLISMITCGIFALVWMFVQAAWAKKIDPANRSTFWFAIGISFGVLGYALVFAAGLATSADPSAAALTVIPLLPCLVAAQACFSGGIMELRSSLEIHYNTAEPIKLRLSGPLSSLFNVLYFQYHLTRIHRWKTTGHLSKQKIKV